MGDTVSECRRSALLQLGHREWRLHAAKNKPLGNLKLEEKSSITRASFVAAAPN